MSEIRITAGAIAVAALALAASLNSYQLSQQAAASPDTYGVAAAESRMEQALSILPGSATIGYLSDLPADQNAGMAAFMAAQYAVAPRALVPIDKAQTEWVIGNFARSAAFAALGARSGLTVVRDFGNGVVIYRRSRP